MKNLQIFCTLFSLMSLQALAVDRSELEEVRGAKWVDAPFNDGDSFHLRLPKTDLVARLYFVDCPETSATDEAGQRRVLEQKRYFGIKEGPTILEMGRKASTRTSELLKPGEFVVHTTYARAPGRSDKPRTYVMITLQDGRDLAGLLVQEGLARAYGVKRTRPDGVSAAEYAEQLKDGELAAAMNRNGCWSASDPSRLAAMRSAQRDEERKLALEAVGVAGIVTPDRPLNVNTASMEELQLIRGIGPVTASHIVKGRPYGSLKDLLRVDGVGETRLTAWEPFLTVEPRAGNPGSDR